MIQKYDDFVGIENPNSFASRAGVFTGQMLFFGWIGRVMQVARGSTLMVASEGGLYGAIIAEAEGSNKVAGIVLGFAVGAFGKFLTKIPKSSRPLQNRMLAPAGGRGKLPEIVNSSGYNGNVVANEASSLVEKNMIEIQAIRTGGAKEVEVLAPNKRSIDVYAPDKPLPRTEEGIPIPGTDAPHTQLGKKGSKRRPGEKYPQAREFDKNGKPVKTIDFTDHGEPLIHPNPHEHPCEPNPTGGTPQRGNPKPLENWKY